jgi:hypothetical protein
MGLRRWLRDFFMNELRNGDEPMSSNNRVNSNKPETGNRKRQGAPSAPAKIDDHRGKQKEGSSADEGSKSDITYPLIAPVPVVTND